MVAGGGAGLVEGSEKSFFPTVFKWHMKTQVLHADAATRKLAPSVRKNGVRGGQAHKQRLMSEVSGGEAAAGPLFRRLLS